MTDPKKVGKLIILGGGISGLAAAYLAAKEGVETTVLEGGKEFGGLINTFELGGKPLEFYYHHHFEQDLELQWLLGELGIADRLKFYHSTMGFYTGSKIYPFNGALDLLKFKPLPFINKFLFGLITYYLGKFASWERGESRSAISWFNRFAGKQVSEVIWGPMLRVKFGPHADRVPIAWIIGRLSQRIQSRKGTKEMLGYLEGSLKTLKDHLLKSLQEKGVKLHTQEPVKEILCENGQLIGVRTEKQIIPTENVFSTMPSTSLAPLVKDLDPAFYEQLSAIKYFGVVCTILELNTKLSDIYWLNIADPTKPFGGIIEHTNFIPKEKYGGSHVVYLSRYFDLKEDIAGMDERELGDLMLEGVKTVYTQFKESFIKSIFVFRSNNAAVVVDTDFSQKIPPCKSPLRGLYQINMAHLYPDERSVNNAIRLASDALNIMGIKNEVPQGPNYAGAASLKKELLDAQNRNIAHRRRRLFPQPNRRSSN